MTTINRKEYTNDLSKGAINVNDMSPETKEKLAKAGVSEAELAKIAGNDGQIHGADEFRKLFKVVDKFDKNGSASSFETHDKAGNRTVSGQVHEALNSEVEKNRAKASMQGVIHLGMRDASVKEVETLEKGNPAANGGVESIKGYASNGKITHNGKDFDLTSKAGLTSFCNELKKGPDKMPKDQAEKFKKFLEGQNEKSRDELAQLGLKFYQAGEGKLPVNRLVLSGHGWDGEISGDDGAAFKLTDVEALAKVFPKGAGKIEHVAVSACFCSGKAHFETLQSAFPNLKSAFAYNAYSPKAETQAPAHLKKWESMTDGEDPSQVDPAFKKTATWNIKDGIQGLPKITLPEAMKSADALKHTLEAYRSGRKNPSEGPKDDQLNEYYERLAVVIQHSDASAEEKAEYEAIRKEVFKLRHPELSH